MPRVPFVFDVFSERDQAAALAASGVGQKELSERQALARGDKSAALGGTALGAGGAVAVNAMVLDEKSLPKYTQPGTTIAPATVSVPPRDSNPMRVSATSNYVQPNNFTPQARAGTTPTKANPMGL